jgi:excisionase family DNA binding protein
MKGSSQWSVTEDMRLAYTVEEALSLLSIGRNKLYAEARAGRLKLRKSGRRTLVLAEDLKAYLSALPLITFDISGSD